MADSARQLVRSINIPKDKEKKRKIKIKHVHVWNSQRIKSIINESINKKQKYFILTSQKKYRVAVLISLEVELILIIVSMVKKAFL